MELTYTAIEGKSRRYYIAIAVLAVIALAGLLSFTFSYIYGHQLFGSSNLIPWGLPIIIAIYLIGLSAGSLILSSLTYVFGQATYKPIARMAVFLAIVLIFGAMVAIAVDLGRPEKFWRLMMFFYLNNMKSMFAVNGILYGGYFAISMVYLGAILANNMVWVKRIGIFAVCWACLVHMGTGAIFGFTSSREIFNSPIKPFEFLAAAMVSGLALLIISVVLTFKFSRRDLNKDIVTGLARLLAILIAVISVLVLVDKLTHVYSGDRDATMFLFTGKYWPMFWFGQIGLAYVIPLIILIFPKTRNDLKWILVATSCVVIGIFFERLVLVIPGLAYPLHLYPGHVEGIWGEAASFSIMPVEIILSIGIFAFLGVMYFLGLRFLELLPPPKPEPEPAIVESVSEEGASTEGEPAIAGEAAAAEG